MKVKVLYIDLMAGDPTDRFDPDTGLRVMADFWRIRTSARADVGGEWILTYTLPRDAELPEVGSEITVSIS